MSNRANHYKKRFTEAGTKEFSNWSEMSRAFSGVMSDALIELDVKDDAVRLGIQELRGLLADTGLDKNVQRRLSMVLRFLEKSTEHD